MLFTVSEVARRSSKCATYPVNHAMEKGGFTALFKARSREGNDIIVQVRLALGAAVCIELRKIT
jgi:hypothetical protein